MLAKEDDSLAAATATMAEVSLSAADSGMSIWKSKSKGKNKRRFSDEQIRSLESMFRAESRPELQIKQQLANELNLQPRQVAIWFQNKRARSKSKLIEQDYNMLKCRYNTLASKFDSLKKENQTLLNQLQRLRNLVGEPKESRIRWVGQDQKGIGKEYEKRDTKSEAEEHTNNLPNFKDHETQMPFPDDSSEDREFLGEETRIRDMAEIVPDGFLSSRNWCNFQSTFESSCALDHPTCSSQWWDL